MTETALGGAFEDGPLSAVQNDAEACPHDAPMMPPAHMLENSDGLDDVLAEVDAILSGDGWGDDVYADAGWRRESMGARMSGGQMVKRFRWRRGAREKRQTYIEKGYVTLADLSAEERERHERNRAKYTTHSARAVEG